MPVFVVTGLDIDDGGKLRAETREKHLAYVEPATDRLLVAGPILNEDDQPVGSLYVINAESEADARSFVADDPYVKAGVFRSTDIKRWRLVIKNI